MFKEIIEKFVEQQRGYKELKIDRDRINNKYGLLIQAYNDVKKENKEHEDYIDLLKSDIASQQKKRKKILNQILKLIKTLEANKTTKEIKKLVNEVKKIV